MSQDFRFKFDRMRENNPAVPVEKGNAPANAGDKYDTIGYSRNIGFAWLGGKRIFLSYSYLISCEYEPAESKIVLSFTTHIVTLKGAHLGNLYDELMMQVTRIVACVEARYNAVLEKNDYAVNEIMVEKNG